MPLSNNDIEVLRQHVEDLFAAHAREHALEQQALILARDNAEQTLRTALNAIEKRLEGMNEFRGTISDIGAKSVTRMEWETSRESLSDKIDTRFRALERLVYMATGGVLLLGIVVNLILYFIKGR